VGAREVKKRQRCGNDDTTREPAHTRARHKTNANEASGMMESAVRHKTN
jgi:hypothetical protein